MKIKSYLKIWVSLVIFLYLVVVGMELAEPYLTSISGEQSFWLFNLIRTSLSSNWTFFTFFLIMLLNCLLLQV
ncbi:MAG: hypothetical protein EAX86_10470 [Candidatus Heimdallarchaeota archaeon]|nr:hypothetical protein [Candidatus Heimdallarchaeota archaeon]